MAAAEAQPLPHCRDASSMHWSIDFDTSVRLCLQTATENLNLQSMSEEQTNKNAKPLCATLRFTFKINQALQKMSLQYTVIY